MADKWTTLKTGDLIRRAEDFLTEYILNSEVAPGEYLPPEQILCERLGIGRSTLREAVSILQSKGLVERRHGVGVRVIDRSQEAASDMLQLMLKRASTSARDLLEMRRLYEEQAAVWAAQRATPKERAEIEAALSRMRAAHASPEAFAEADLAFHLTIAQATHNAVMTLFAETIRALLGSAILANLQSDFSPGDTIRYHEHISEAVQRQCPEDARRAMAEHLSDTERKLRNPKENQDGDNP